MRNSNSFEESDSAWLGDLEGGLTTEKFHATLDSVYATGPLPSSVRDSSENLSARLDAELGPQIFYGEVPQSPVGRVFIAVGPAGILAIDFNLQEAEFHDQLKQRGYKRLVRSDDETLAARREVTEYLKGQLLDFSLPSDLSGLTQFQQDVLLLTAQIPRGQVTTYGEIARTLGKPKSSRAVGRALGSNPVPLVIPCHRVIGSDGSLRGYSGGGGIQSKAFLLELEGAMLGGF